MNTVGAGCQLFQGGVPDGTDRCREHLGRFQPSPFTEVSYLMFSATTPSKTCTKCGSTKPLDFFYRHEGMADGYRNECKVCSSVYRRDLRTNNPERIVQHRRVCRAYHKENKTKPEWMQARRDRQRVLYKSHRRPDPESHKRRKMRGRAHSRVKRAVGSGRLVPSDACERCGHDFSASRREGHHADYSKPLEVEWLCQDCHAEHHRKIA